MPRVARLLLIFRRFDASGIQRYGFHGLSYAYLMGELARVAGAKAAQGRVILAHPGNGASLAAVLGGLETLVFSGGIGENAGEVRARVCSGLQFPGIDLDEARNAVNGPVISIGASRVTVRVIRTDKERTIARHVCRLLLHDGQQTQGVE
jgi:acetate kinase